MKLDYKIDRDCSINLVDYKTNRFVASCDSDVDAQLIIKCVNSYEELINKLTRLAEEFGKINPDFNILNDAEVLLESLGIKVNDYRK